MKSFSDFKAGNLGKHWHEALLITLLEGQPTPCSRQPRRSSLSFLSDHGLLVSWQILRSSKGSEGRDGTGYPRRHVTETQIHRRKFSFVSTGMLATVIGSVLGFQLNRLLLHFAKHPFRCDPETRTLMASWKEKLAQFVLLRSWTNDPACMLVQHAGPWMQPTRHWRFVANDARVTHIHCLLIPNV